MKKSYAISLITLFAAAPLWAGECVIQITRDACPGKETEALKPYNGQKTTEEKKKVGDEAACQAFAEKSVKIIRKGTLSGKSVVAKHDGAAVAGGKAFTDKADCK